MQYFLFFFYIESDLTANMNFFVDTSTNTSPMKQGKQQSCPDCAKLGKRNRQMRCNLASTKFKLRKLRLKFNSNENRKSE